MESGLQQEGETQRVPPHNLEAERAVLGAILLAPELIHSALEHLQAEDFYAEPHRLIFESMSALLETGSTLDVVTVKDHLKGQGRLDRAGGAEYLGELLDAVSTTANIDYHCRLVLEKSLLRRLIEVSERTIEQSFAQSDPVEEVFESAEKALLELGQRRQQGALVSIRKAAAETFDMLSHLFDRKAAITGLATGFPDLDELLAGLHPGELIVIAARPSIGKTTFGLNIVHHVAMKRGRPAAILSLEMAREQLVTRMLCSEAQVDGQRLRKGFLSKEEWPVLTTAVGRLSSAPIFIDDSSNLTVYEIRSRVRRLQSRHGVDLVLVDYLQLIRSRTRYDSRQQEITAISNALKAMAKELRIPVIALAQLSREVERRPDKRPQLSDLRESGAIEQDADVVGFLHRPEFYNIKEIEIGGKKVPSAGLAQLIVAKQRNGPTGVVNLAFLKGYMQFRPLADTFDERVGVSV